MHPLKEPEGITLAEGLTLLERRLPAEQAKARLRQAFVQKALGQEPMFALPYDEAHIDWTTGSVKIPRKTERFCPTFRRSEFNRHFFEDRIAPPSYSPQTVIAAADMLKSLGHSGLDRFLLELNLPDQSVGKGSELMDRATSLAEYVIKNSEQLTPERRTVAHEIVRRAIQLYCEDVRSNLEHREREAFAAAMQREEPLRSAEQAGEGVFGGCRVSATLRLCSGAGQKPSESTTVDDGCCPSRKAGGVDYAQADTLGLEHRSQRALATYSMLVEV